MQSQKRQNVLRPFSRQTIQHHSKVYGPTTDAEEAEVEQLYEDLLELTPKKDVLSSQEIGMKSSKSRDFCSSRQIWPCGTK